jgi:Amt family ammonium transporter
MANEPLESLSRSLLETQTAMNIMWTLLAGFLVMFMQAGFALLETGLTHAKNAAHTMGMNFLVYSIGILGFWLVGFGFQMGGIGEVASLGGALPLTRELTITIAGRELGLLGLSGFMLPASLCTPAVAVLFFFHMVFMDTTCTIPTGALAERWKFSSFAIFSFCIATVIYPVYANWVWGGGFLATLGKNFGWGHGHVDFAGSSVVHMTGGVTALVTAHMLGPRLGKYRSDGTVNALAGHNAPMAVLGTFILAFGWFGFNAGSTLAATDTRIAVVAVNTMLASAAGCMSACWFTWFRFGRPDLSMMCNGMLAGLVAITAPCAFVPALAAVIIGAVAGVLVTNSALFVERVLRVDDPVGAVSVHGVGGAWGILALGLFADGRYGHGLNGVAGGVTGLFYGDPGQFVAALAGILVNIVYVGSMSAICFALTGKLVGNRVPAGDEQAGLDVPELGMEGYPPAVAEQAPSPTTTLAGLWSTTR